MPTTLLSFSACLIKVLANTFVYDGALDEDFICSPVFTLNFETPWNLSSDFSANL